MELIHSLHGVLIEHHAILEQGHAKTIDLLRQLKAGEIQLADVELNGNGWKITRPPISWPRKSQA